MKKRLSSCLEKARDALSQAKKRRKTGVVQPEATAHPRTAEEVGQSQARDSLIAREVAGTGVVHSLADLAVVPATSGQQVGFHVRKSFPLFTLLVFSRWMTFTNLWRSVERAAQTANSRNAIEI
jgi:hypothetical protein